MLYYLSFLDVLILPIFLRTILVLLQIFMKYLKFVLKNESFQFTIGELKYRVYYKIFKDTFIVVENDVHINMEAVILLKLKV